MADSAFEHYPPSYDASAIGSIPINFAGADQEWPGKRARGLHISTGGTLKVTWVNGDVDTLVVVAGDRLPWSIAKIWQTGSSGVVGNILF